MKVKLQQLGSRVSVIDTRMVKPAAKTADPFYQTEEYKRWQARVIKRADGQCEWRVNGMRCQKQQPEHRMFADHIVEVKDGGAPYDITNGQCLCGQHHTIKTNAERAKRIKA